MAVANTFAPTHEVPDGGLDAWSLAVRTGPPTAHLDPGLEVQVVERRADSAQVACSNGWTAWVDDGRLVAWTPPPPEPPAPSRGAIRGLTLISLVGALAIAGGSFLDWWKLGSASVTAWDIPIAKLLTGATGDGFKTGPVLVVLALVLLVPIATGRPLPSIVVLPVAALAMGLAASAALRGLTGDVTVYPDIGLILTLGGGTLAAIDGFGLTQGRR